MTENKNHWYDGWFYDKIIAPNQDKLFGQIKNIIEQGSDIIDVGCGTGRPEFSLALSSLVFALFPFGGLLITGKYFYKLKS
ncbi:MAG: hypothetical protein IPJ37_07995 [Bacteroidales bacterium]|nr:hypothetical protein [Bacteroidales bacterium]